MLTPPLTAPNPGPLGKPVAAMPHTQVLLAWRTHHSRAGWGRTGSWMLSTVSHFCNCWTQHLPVFLIVN